MADTGVLEPSMSLVPAVLRERPGCPVLVVGGQQIAAAALLRQRPALRRHLGRRIVLGLGPGHLQDAVVGLPAAAGPAAPVLHASVRLVRAAGAVRLVGLELADAECSGGPPVPLWAWLGHRSRVVVGAAMMLAVDVRNMLVLDGDGRCGS
ncbi:hypothetical protein ABT369_09140 [Dactylosporangium sp. NPDC000244]|uniref:hypothetical protein n=1 Tax=Dactylosporangium sp. NPDC000244 TaxID=3154365 RepID=UPI00333036AB